jgi:hypothetical protein
MLGNIISNRGSVSKEILIALVIVTVGIALRAVSDTSQEGNATSRQEVMSMQPDGSPALDEIVYHAAMAGYRLSPGLEAIQSTNTSPDTVTFRYATDPVCACTLAETTSSPSADLRLTTGSIDCLKANTWACIYDPKTEKGEYFMVSDVEPGNRIIEHKEDPLSRVYPAGSEVYAINVVIFYIDKATDARYARLMCKHSGEPYVFADHIDDLEISYTLAHGKVVDSLTDFSSIREINISLVAGSRISGRESGSNYQADTFSTSVYLRNEDF